MNYEILVNKENPISQETIDKIPLISCYDVDDKPTYVEQKTYQAYLALQKALEKKKIFVKITSAFRSLSSQKAVYEEFTEKYGKEYADKVVAPVGTSEHHTGLAIDLTLVRDGDIIFDKETDAKEKEQGFQKIHPDLASYGFILRYPLDKETITGYCYEPWHIRYVGKSLAKKLSQENVTLEEYYKQKQ